jgi:predicted dehydrogenase
MNHSGHLLFRSGAQGAIICGWDRRNHIFELDLYGSRGRIRVSGDGARLELFRFEDSPRYSGYRELIAVDPDEDLEPQTTAFQAGQVDYRPEENRLIVAVQDLVRCAATGKTPACSGKDGLGALEIACAMVESARRQSERIVLAHHVQKEL